MSESQPDEMPGFNGYQMVDRMWDGDGFRIYMDGYDDLWLSDGDDNRGFCVPNHLLASIWQELQDLENGGLDE